MRKNIDPPYNTGNDFIYNDKFAENRDDYEQEAGIKDENGNLNRTDGLKKNSKDGGHYHSNWLNMMYPRLYLARNLLRDDGVMFVSIDDNEVANLRKIMDEIFGEENFITSFIWKKTENIKMDSKFASVNKDYVLCYRRSGSIEKFQKRFSDESRYNLEDDKGKYYLRKLDGKNGYTKGLDYVITFDGKDYYPGGSYEKWHKRQTEGGASKDPRWLWSKEKFEQGLKDDEIIFKGNNVYNKVRLTDNPTKPYTDFIEASSGQSSQAELNDLFDGERIFDHPKPVNLITELANMVGVGGDDIILDFFAGSGTAAHAINQLNAEDGGNRRWVSAQLPEQTDKKSEAHKAGYATIAEVAKERIRRASKKIAEEFKDELAKREEPIDLGFKVYKVSDSNFKVWNELVKDEDQLRQQMLEQLDPLVDGATDEEILTEILLKKGVTVVEDIEKFDDYYFVPAKKMAISLSRHITQELFDEMQTKNPTQIILLDIGLQDNLNLKTNLFLQAEQKDLKLEVV